MNYKEITESAVLKEEPLKKRNNDYEDGIFSRNRIALPAVLVVGRTIALYNRDIVRGLRSPLLRLQSKWRVR